MRYNTQTQKPPAVVMRGDALYQNTCLQIPFDLKRAAKELGINMTQVFISALESEVKKRDIGAERSKKENSKSS